MRRPLTSDDPRHGTANGYSNYGCRCERCRKAWAAYYTHRRHVTGRAEPRDQWLARRAYAKTLERQLQEVIRQRDRVQYEITVWKGWLDLHRRMSEAVAR